MGTVGNTGRLGAYQSDIFASGLDLGRSDFSREPGYYKAADSANIQQGQMVSLNAAGELVVADAVDVVGVAKWNKVDAANAVEVDQAVTVVFGGVSLLGHGNVSNVAVRASANGGTLIPAASNYTLSAANGTITWDNPTSGTAAPANGATVYVTYTFPLTAQDYRFQGRNFFNSVNDVDGLTDGRLTIIEGPALIFTTQYDTSEVYVVGAPLYCGGDTTGEEGLFTVTATNSELVGHVHQPPTQDDPYLGVKFQGGRAA